MFGFPPKALSDVIDLHPRSGWGTDQSWTVHLPAGGHSGHFWNRVEAVEFARERWPNLKDDQLE